MYAENRREYNRRVQQCATESWKTVEAPESEASRAITSATAAEQPVDAARPSASPERHVGEAPTEPAPDNGEHQRTQGDGGGDASS